MKDLRLEPERVSVTTHQAACVTVSGRGFGRISVGGERRWVRGEFAERFSVSGTARAVEVRATWPFGSQIWLVAFEPRTDLRPPRLLYPARAAHTESSGPRLAFPRLRPLRFSTPAVPRGVELRARRQLRDFQRNPA